MHVAPVREIHNRNSDSVLMIVPLGAGLGIGVRVTGVGDLVGVLVGVRVGVGVRVAIVGKGLFGGLGGVREKVGEIVTRAVFVALGSGVEVKGMGLVKVGKGVNDGVGGCDVAVGDESSLGDFVHSIVHVFVSLGVSVSVAGCEVQANVNTIKANSRRRKL